MAHPQRGPTPAALGADEGRFRGRHQNGVEFTPTICGPLCLAGEKLTNQKINDIADIINGYRDNGCYRQNIWHSK